MFCSYLRDFFLINYCCKLNQVSPVAKLALKVDLNLLNQQFKLVEWLVEWLTDLLRHLDSQGTRTLETLKALKALGHSKGTWALGHSKHLGTWALEEFGYLKGTWALGHSRNSGTWPLRHLGTRALERHLSTWALEALKTLYSAESWCDR